MNITARATKQKLDEYTIATIRGDLNQLIHPVAIARGNHLDCEVQHQGRAGKTSKISPLAIDKE